MSRKKLLRFNGTDFLYGSLVRPVAAPDVPLVSASCLRTSGVALKIRIFLLQLTWKLRRINV